MVWDLRKSPPLSVQQFWLKEAIPYQYIDIEHYQPLPRWGSWACFISLSIQSSSFSWWCDTSQSLWQLKLSTLANVCREKAKVKFEGFTYSRSMIKKIKSYFPRVECYDGKKNPSIFARHTRQHGDKLCLYISRNLK